MNMIRQTTTLAILFALPLSAKPQKSKKKEKENNSYRYWVAGIAVLGGTAWAGMELYERKMKHQDEYDNNSEDQIDEHFVDIEERFEKTKQQLENEQRVDELKKNLNKVKSQARLRQLHDEQARINKRKSLFEDINRKNLLTNLKLKQKKQKEKWERRRSSNFDHIKGILDKRGTPYDLNKLRQQHGMDEDIHDLIDYDLLMKKHV
jgi:hypothetical protein